jgi:tRNA A37 threonylcarbamoyltransferase TsaD
MEAHALVARMAAGGPEALPFPFLCLLVSGGHNLLVLVKGVGSYMQLGTTLDDALGELFAADGLILHSFRCFCAGLISVCHPVACICMCLLVSGGHNLLVLVKGVGSYMQLGTTLDDALGELPDADGLNLHCSVFLCRFDQLMSPCCMYLVCACWCLVVTTCWCW